MTEQTQGSEHRSPAGLDAAVIVFGIDAHGKTHASRFTAAEAELAEQSAGLMRMRVLRLVFPEEAALADGVAQGRLFSRTGRSFVPFVTRSRFALLDAAPNAFAPEPPADAGEVPVVLKRAKGLRVASTEAHPAEGTTNAASEAAEAHGDPAAIRVGSLVLACEAGEAGTWWVARIISDRDPDTFELRWGGEWQDEPSFTRQRDHVAILPTAFVNKLT